MPRFRNATLTLLIFVAGSVSLGAEIAVARLLAPYFGSSTVVWANTIGVVLVALSLGYWLGGRLADRLPNERDLRLLALWAAVAVAAVPLLAGPLLEAAISAFDALDAGAFIGSLVGVLLLAAVPVTMLGAISPWAIRLSLESVEEAGAVAGRLYAISTVGSLAGTFVAALVLIPLIGAQRTFLCFAALLALAAAIGLSRRALIAPVILVAMLALPPGLTKPADSGDVVFEQDTTEQYARVVESPDGRRVLELNEGRAIHSVYEPGRYLTGGYWDTYLTLPFAARSTPPREFAMLGNAGGTVARAYARYFPETRIDGVDIDGELAEVGRRYFGLENPRFEDHAEDARVFLRRSDRRYDVIGLDTYRQPYIPFHLATREFFRLARERLAPGGVVLINVGHPPGDFDLERVLAATLRSEFRTVLRQEAKRTNTMLLATDAPASAARLRAAVPRLPRALRETAVREADTLEPAYPGGEVYTDDLAPVEWLIDRSIVSYAAGED